VIQLLDRTIDKRIQIVQQLKAEPPTVMGDPTQLQNALLNLALNARDAMPSGGRLTFMTTSVTVRHDDTRQVGFALKAGDYLVVVVQDTGVGMDRETLAHVYEPFFTTKDVGKGTGLGLSSVYGCVKNHGGLIHATSETEKGTTFTVYFPLLRGAEPAAPKPVDTSYYTKSQSVAGNKAHILVVDDEPIVRELCQTILSDFGYGVTTCGDAREAVAFYRERFRDVALVIIDMIMPYMSGSECFAEMHRINPDVKAILATGYDVSERTQKLLTRGISGFLQKPFKEESLLKMIADVLQGHSAAATQAPLRG
jgi:CheY-like chemotaxis protein